jgi:hypothetical protein
MGNNINVKITADVVDLRSKLALANADFAATQKQLKALAVEASSGGIKQASPELLKAAEASAQAESKVSLLKGEMKKFGAEASKIGHGHTGFLRYIREVFDEISSGRTRYLPSTLATLAQQYGGLSTAALGAVGAVAAVAAALGYLEYKALEAKKEVDDLTTAFRLTGRGGEIGAGGVQYMLDFLNSVPNASSAATQAFVQFAATSGQVNLVLANQVGQLLPAFEKAFGKKAPEAAAKLLKSLSDLSVDGFRKLDQEMLNLSPTEYEQVEHLIAIGNQAKATAEIIKILAHRTGSYVKSLGDEVYRIEQKMSDVVNAAAFREGIHLNFDPKSIQSIENVKKILSSQGGLVSESAIRDLDTLESKLRAIRALETKTAKAQANQHYTAELQAAETLNEKLDQQAQIKAHLVKLEADLADARKREDQHGIKTFSHAIAYEQAKLKKLQEEADRKKHSSPQEKEHQHAIALAHRSAQEVERRKVEAVANAGRQITQMLRDDEVTDARISEEKLQQRKAMLQQELAAGRITNTQMVDDEIALTEQIYNVDLKRLKQEAELNRESVVDQNRTTNQIRDLYAKLMADLAALDAKRAQAVQKDAQKEVTVWERSHRGLLNSERSLIQASLGSWQGFEQSVESLALRQFTNLITGEAKMWTERLAIQQSGADESKAITLKSALEQIANDAAKAASSTYAAVAAIPVVGPFLAPAAAAGAAVAVFGFEALTSAAGGQWQVYKDGQLTELHKDEMVMPAHLANPMRAAVSSIASGGGGSESRQVPSSTPDVHFHVHANDTRSVQAWLNENGEHIARTLQRVWRNNGHLAPMGRSAA